MTVFEIASGPETFKAEIVNSPASDSSLYIRVSHGSGALETLVIAYPNRSASTLVNVRDDDIEAIAQKLASRLAFKWKKPVLLSLEMQSSHELPHDILVKQLTDIEKTLNEKLNTC